MGISSITSANSMSVMQMTGANSKVQKSKSIQNEITNAQQQIRKLSSQEDLSAAEKANERKKLQKEISGLNTELKQHQDELSRSQRREILMAKPQEEEKEPEKEDRSEDKIQSKETSSDTTDKKSLPAGKQQAAQPGTVISQNNDGTVIFKGALNQDKNPAIGTENKQAGESNEKAIDEKEEKNEDNGIIADSNLSSNPHFCAVRISRFSFPERIGNRVWDTAQTQTLKKQNLGQRILVSLLQKICCFLTIKL